MIGRFFTELFRKIKRRQELRNEIKRYRIREKNSIRGFVDYTVDKLYEKKLIFVKNIEAVKNDITVRAEYILDISGDITKALIDAFEHTLKRRK